MTHHEQLNSDIYEPFAGQRDFTIGPIIGSGGFGEVRIGIDTMNHRLVAIKIIPIHKNGLAQPLEEVTFSSFNSANNVPWTIKIHTVLRDEKNIYVVMEYLDVRQFLFADKLFQHQEVKQKGDVFVRQLINSLLSKLANHIDAAWDVGIMHYDIKPANIAIHWQDGSEIRVIDFGAAKQANERTGQVNQFTGSPIYSSFERLSGEPEDLCSEVYSYGIVAYELLTGVTPFDHILTFDNDGILECINIIVQQRWIAHLTDCTKILFEDDIQTVTAFIEVFKKLLHFKPEKRYDTTTEAYAALLPFLNQVKNLPSMHPQSRTQVTRDTPRTTIDPADTQEQSTLTWK